MTDHQHDANPYRPAKGTTTRRAGRRSPPSVRWLAVPFFVLCGAMVSVIIALIFAEVFMPAGDFTEILAAGFAMVGLVVGGIVGLIAGIGFARGTHLR